MILTKQNFEMMRLKHMLTDLTSRIRITTLKASFSSYIDNIQDGYVGIGVIVGVNDDNQIEVVAPFEDSPAYNAGIQPSDIIKAIDGVEYSGDKLSEAVDNIKNGEIGTTVDIKNSSR